MVDDHHSGLTGHDVSEALLNALDKWERGGCDCCGPNPQSEAFDALGLFFDEEGDLHTDSDMDLAARLHDFALRLALATAPRVPVRTK
jgi:hypothetical protein